jgi:hypothetical protein
MADEKPPAERAAVTTSAGMIVFSCGNGHRLSVPLALAGRKGKCSKCGMPVQIPAPEEVAAAENADPPPTEVMSRVNLPGEQPAASPEPAPAQQDMFAGLGELPATAGEKAFAPAQPRSAAGAAEWTPPAEEVVSNPTALLVARLWEERRHGGIIELHVTGGSVILPEWFEPRWSGGTHGLFASRAADGTVTLTAVAWEAVQKVVVRQVDGLPDGMFE